VVAVGAKLATGLLRACPQLQLVATAYYCCRAPGVLTYEGTVCDEWGQALDRAVEKFGGEPMLQIEQGQRSPTKWDSSRR
jgi:hypothetical protein